MPKNIYDQIRNFGGIRKRGNSEPRKRINSILKSDESKYYKEAEEKEAPSELNELDALIGDEKDAPDYLSDIEKLSFRELDKRNPNDQLRVLKLEYNRIYDKLNLLNNLLVDADREKSSTQLETRNLLERIDGFRGSYRDLVNQLPGNPTLKSIVNEGNWKRAQVHPLISDALEQMKVSYNDIDKIIDEKMKDIKEENFKLKERVLKYKDAVNEIDKIKEMLLRQKDSAPTSTEQEPSSNVAPTTKETNDEIDEPSAINHKLAPTKSDAPDKNRSNDKVPNSDNTTPEKHESHFSGFLSDVKSSVEEQLERGADELGETSPRNSAIENDEKMTNPNLADKNHPLSPNYVETEKQYVSDLFDDNLSSYLNNLSDNQIFVLGIIGRTGLSRNPDLRDYLSSHEEGLALYGRSGKIDYQSMSSDVSELRGKDVLSEEKMNLGSTGGGANVIVYELSDIGKQCFKKLFNDDPVVPEKKRILDLHASLEHGYMIKDSAKIFEELGYRVHSELDDVTFHLKDGRRKVFDLVLEDTKSKLLHIEVERGTHNKGDFFDAMDKIFEITDEFYFVCPNESVKNKKTKQMFFMWINERLGGIKKANLDLNMTTISTLRKKPRNIWEKTELRNLKL